MRTTQTRYYWHYAEADSLLRQAWALDTTFLVPLSYAAIALWNAGEYVRLDSLVRFLAPRRDRLSPHYERRLAFLRGTMGRNRAAITAAALLLERLGSAPDPG